LTHAAVGGVATFANLSIDKVGTGYTLTATGAGSATSAAFNITAGTATQLVFSVQPSTTPAGAAVTPAVPVTAQGAEGRPAGGVAACATRGTDKVGTGCTRTAAGAGSATSAAFNITAGTATQLVFSVQPSTTPAGAAITPAVQVTAQDAEGNTATGFTGNVTVAIGTNPGSGTLGGTLTEAAAAGEAKIAHLTINKVGTGYTV